MNVGRVHGGATGVSLRQVAATLRRTTEALLLELAHPGTPQPAWDEFEWRVARVAAAIHGLSAWLAVHSRWRGPDAWQSFLHSQRHQTLSRELQITEQLRALDNLARRDRQPVMLLKGAAMLTLGIHGAGERPMSDIDLLVRDPQRAWLHETLQHLGYAPSGGDERHDIFERVDAIVPDGLGEVAGCPVRIEVHERVAERLPATRVDITAGLWPLAASGGLCGYVSRVALLRHLLLHTAGNMSTRWLRAMQLLDLARVTAGFDDDDWRELVDVSGEASAPWWAYPPLRLMQRVLGADVPEWLLSLTRRRCPRALAWQSEHRSVADFSGSHLWVGALPALAWSRTPVEMIRYAHARLCPGATQLVHLAERVRRQPWGSEGAWYTHSQGARLRRWLISRPARPQVLHAVLRSLTA